MYLTGFADEAARSIEDQIRITKNLGWSYIESRNIGGTNLHDLSEADFDHVEKCLNQSGVRINCFGSAIANWATKLSDPFEQTLEKVNLAIPKMKRLGSKMIRIMSYPPAAIGEDQQEEERFRRMAEVCRLFSEAGLLAVHENCNNYGGLSAEHTLKMLAAVPDMKLVYDTGNPVFTQEFTSSNPEVMQNAWDFYAKVKAHVVYIHIKDGVRKDGKTIFTYPGEGDGHVERIVKDLVESGYDGGISIEPHMAQVAHDASLNNQEVNSEEVYLEYGRRMEAMILKLGGKLDHL